MMSYLENDCGGSIGMLINYNTLIWVIAKVGKHVPVENTSSEMPVVHVLLETGERKRREKEG